MSVDELAGVHTALSEPSFPLAIAHMKINSASPVPIYEQICRAIRVAISSGDLPPGTMLPTSREFARALGVGRNTIVTAYTRLVAEGYLTSNTRRGTRVAENPVGLLPAMAEERPAQSRPPEFPPAPEISFRARYALEELALEPALAPSALHAPDPSLYPRNPLSRLIAQEFCRAPGNDTQHGLQRFQTAMADFLRHMRGVHCEPSQIIPITGLESALDLTARVMIDPGHCIYVEDPASDTVRQSLRAAGGQLVPIPSDSNGADITQASGPPPRLIFASPSVSFPLGRQMTEERRLAMLEAAQRWNAVIFECDALWELSYTGSRIRAMQGYDRNGPVLYFGSLNQTLGPHIRVGYLVVPPALVKPFTEMAQRIAYGPEGFLLAALASFIEDSHYAMHSKTIRSVYAARMAVLVEACRAQFQGATVLEPSGGLNLAVRFNDPIDEIAICRAAGERGLSVSPLSRFYDRQRERPAPAGLVLGFGTVPERLLETMARRIAEIVAKARESAKPLLVA